MKLDISTFGIAIGILLLTLVLVFNEKEMNTLKADSAIWQKAATVNYEQVTNCH